MHIKAKPPEVIEDDRAYQLASYDECSERGGAQLAGKNNCRQTVNRPKDPTEPSPPGSLKGLPGKGKGTRLTKV